MKEILVTGNHGFIGSYLIDALNKRGDFVVDTLDRATHPLTNPEKLQEKLKGKDTVIHLAGKTQVQGDALAIAEVNIQGTLGLLEGIAMLTDGRPKKLVFSSTFAVFPPQDKLLVENSPLEPRNIYGLTKLWAEQAISLYASKYGFASVILRFSNVYGPGMPPFLHSVIATFIEKIKHRETLTVNGDGSQKRDFIFVRDVVDAIVKAVTWEGQTRETEVFNICSGRGISIREVVDQLGKIAGQKIDVVYNPVVIEQGNWIGDNSKAKKNLDWHPITTFGNGLKKTWNARQ